MVIIMSLVPIFFNAIIDVYGSLENTVKYLASQLTQLKTEFLHSFPGGSKVLIYVPRVLKVIVLEI